MFSIANGTWLAGAPALAAQTECDSAVGPESRFSTSSSRSVRGPSSIAAGPGQDDDAECVFASGAPVRGHRHRRVAPVSVSLCTAHITGVGPIGSVGACPRQSRCHPRCPRIRWFDPASVGARGRNRRGGAGLEVGTGYRRPAAGGVGQGGPRRRCRHSGSVGARFPVGRGGSPTSSTVAQRERSCPPMPCLDRYLRTVGRGAGPFTVPRVLPWPCLLKSCRSARQRPKPRSRRAGTSTRAAPVPQRYHWLPNWSRNDMRSI